MSRATQSLNSQNLISDLPKDQNFHKNIKINDCPDDKRTRVTGLDCQLQNNSKTDSQYELQSFQYKQKQQNSIGNKKQKVANILLCTFPGNVSTYKNEVGATKKITLIPRIPIASQARELVIKQKQNDSLLKSKAKFVRNSQGQLYKKGKPNLQASQQQDLDKDNGKQISDLVTQRYQQPSRKTIRENQKYEQKTQRIQYAKLINNKINQQDMGKIKDIKSEHLRTFLEKQSRYDLIELWSVFKRMQQVAYQIGQSSLLMNGMDRCQEVYKYDFECSVSTDNNSNALMLQCIQHIDNLIYDINEQQQQDRQMDSNMNDTNALSYMQSSTQMQHHQQQQNQHQRQQNSQYTHNTTKAYYGNPVHASTQTHMHIQINYMNRQMQQYENKLMEIVQAVYKLKCTIQQLDDSHSGSSNKIHQHTHQSNTNTNTNTNPNNKTDNVAISHVQQIRQYQIQTPITPARYQEQISTHPVVKDSSGSSSSSLEIWKQQLQQLLSTIKSHTSNQSIKQFFISKNTQHKHKQSSQQFRPLQSEQHLNEKGTIAIREMQPQASLCMNNTEQMDKHKNQNQIRPFSLSIHENNNIVLEDKQINGQCMDSHDEGKLQLTKCINEMYGMFKSVYKFMLQLLFFYIINPSKSKTKTKASRNLKYNTDKQNIESNTIEQARDRRIGSIQKCIQQIYSKYKGIKVPRQAAGDKQKGIQDIMCLHSYMQQCTDGVVGGPNCRVDGSLASMWKQYIN